MTLTRSPGSDSTLCQPLVLHAVRVLGVCAALTILELLRADRTARLALQDGDQIRHQRNHLPLSPTSSFRAAMATNTIRLSTHAELAGQEFILFQQTCESQIGTRHHRRA